MKRKTKTGGIYKAVRVRGRKNPAKMKAAFAAAKEGFAKWRDLDGLLSRIGREAQRLLEAKPPKAITRDAAEVLRLLGELREHLDRGNARSAGLLALHLGTICERLRIRPFERLVRQGRRSFASKALSRQPRTDHARQEHEQYKRRVAEIQAENPKKSKTWARQQASDKMIIPMTTVYKRIREYDK